VSAGALLRAGLLDGVSVAVAGGEEAPIASAVRALTASLGADVTGPGAGAVLVVDCGSLQAEHEDLVAASAAVWELTRAHAERLIDAGEGGRVFYVCPDEEVAVAAYENLARTLSIEWARRAITTAAIAPGAASGAADVAALVAYLASPAGAYFSGCLLDLRGPG